MKGRGARRSTLTVQRVLRELPPSVERRLSYPTIAVRGHGNIISYLSFSVSAHPTAVARWRSTEELGTLSSTLPDPPQAASNLVRAQQRSNDAVEDEVAATLLCGAQLVFQRSSSSDDDGASDDTPPARSGPDGGVHFHDRRAQEGGSGFGSPPACDDNEPDNGSGKQGVLSMRASPRR